MKQIAELIEGRPLFHVESSDTVRAAAREMADRNIGAIAVLESGRLVGVFSERDIMTRVVVPGLDADATRVADVMTRDIVVAEPSEDLNEALQKMHSLGCRHLPVVDDSKNLVGMISLRDLLKVEGDVCRQRATFLSELVTYSPDYES